MVHVLARRVFVTLGRLAGLSGLAVAGVLGLAFRRLLTGLIRRLLVTGLDIVGVGFTR